MNKILVIIGTTRENRAGEKIARAFFREAEKRTDAEFELIDLRDYPLPFYDEPTSPKGIGLNYKNEVAKKWAQKIAESDGFVIVTAEYNHGYPAVLKNALDYVYDEWNNKPVSFVSYGGAAGGSRAVQQLRQVVIELQMVPLREQIILPFFSQLINEDGTMKDPDWGKKVNKVLDQLIMWTDFLKNFPLRQNDK